MSDEAGNPINVIELATELTIAWLANPNTRASKEEVPDFLKSMHDAVTGLTGTAGNSDGSSEEAGAPAYEPAVTVRKSIASKDHIISMIDGKPYRTLRRHLSTHGLSPAEYRQRYGLKADYPMVAPAYSEQRRAMAKKIGLGRKPGETRGAKGAAAAAPAQRKPRGPRKPKASETASG
jgi:predicted transcriptional regulator